MHDVWCEHFADCCALSARNGTFQWRTSLCLFIRFHCQLLLIAFSALLDHTKQLQTRKHDGSCCSVCLNSELDTSAQCPQCGVTCVWTMLNWGMAFLIRFFPCSLEWSLNTVYTTAGGLGFIAKFLAPKCVTKPVPCWVPTVLGWPVHLMVTCRFMLDACELTTIFVDSGGGGGCGGGVGGISLSIVRYTQPYNIYSPERPGARDLSTPTLMLGFSAQLMGMNFRHL